MIRRSHRVAPLNPRAVPFAVSGRAPPRATADSELCFCTSRLGPYVHQPPTCLAHPSGGVRGRLLIGSALGRVVQFARPCHGRSALGLPAGGLVLSTRRFVRVRPASRRTAPQASRPPERWPARSPGPGDGHDFDPAAALPQRLPEAAVRRTPGAECRRNLVAPDRRRRRRRDRQLQREVAPDVPRPLLDRLARAGTGARCRAPGRSRSRGSGCVAIQNLPMSGSDSSINDCI